MVTLRAVPSFEAFGRLLEASNPLRLDADDGSSVVAGCAGSPQHCPERQTTIPPVSIRLTRPSRS